MTTVLIDIIVLALTGLAAGIGVGAALTEHSLGTVKNAVVGAVGGALGYVLQDFLPLPPLAVGSDGSTLDNSPIEQLLLHGLVGLAAGALLVAAVGFVFVEARRHSKPE